MTSHRHNVISKYAKIQHLCFPWWFLQEATKILKCFHKIISDVTQIPTSLIGSYGYPKLKPLFHLICLSPFFNNKTDITRLSRIYYLVFLLHFVFIKPYFKIQRKLKCKRRINGDKLQHKYCRAGVIWYYYNTDFNYYLHLHLHIKIQKLILFEIINYHREDTI